MPDVEAFTFADLSPGYEGSSCLGFGSLWSLKWLPEGYSMFLAVVDLGTSAELRWGPVHGDEAIYVLEGTLELREGACTQRGALVIESNAVTTVRAKEPTRVLHFGSSERRYSGTGTRSGGAGIHVLGPVGYGEGPNVDSPTASGIDAVYYADSTCKGCTATLLRVWGAAGYASASHSHSQDEIICLTYGKLRVGPVELAPLSAIAVPAGRRYGFRAQEDWEFVNFRRDVSYMTLRPGDPPILEVSGKRGSEV